MHQQPKVAVVMGSRSDWDTMQHCISVLKQLEINYHTQVISAHRTPQLLSEFATSARSQGFEVIIAGAGGAAHLPGMIAAHTSLPVIGVPVKSRALNGLDSLLSIVQMPAGVPVATVAIGDAGAKNAALLAASILSNHNDTIANALDNYRSEQTRTVLESAALEDLDQ